MPLRLHDPNGNHGGCRGASCASVVALGIACGACAAPGVDPFGGAASSSGTSSVGTSSFEDDAGSPRCVPGPGASGMPRTIDEVTMLINSLPPPVTLACLIESLERPLEILASESIFSAQPAEGRDSPRLFVWRGDELVMSVVPAGEASDLLELAQYVEPGRSLKAEVEFPVTQTLPRSAPFDRVQYGTPATVCAFCHRDEVRYEAIDFAQAYVSNALRPDDWTIVPLSRVVAAWDGCEASSGSEGRCELLTAVFDQGQVTPGAFPDSFDTFF